MYLILNDAGKRKEEGEKKNELCSWITKDSDLHTEQLKPVCTEHASQHQQVCSSHVSQCLTQGRGWINVKIIVEPNESGSMKGI